jgi:hypothetical protein
MAARDPEARVAYARKAAIASWIKTGTDPAARRRRTNPGRLIGLRKQLAEIEAQLNDDDTAAPGRPA